jgi:CRP/FNR family transcriptional regulator
MASALLDEKVWHLQHCPLFSGVSEAELKDLEHVTVMLKLKPQERILAAHFEERAVWLVKEGLMSLTYGDAQGKDATILLLSSGDLFGALEEEENFEYGEHAVALRPTILCRMTRQQMENLINRHPELAYRLTKFSWQRIARLQQRLAEIMTKSVRQRLATLLLKLAAEYGQDCPDGGRSLGLTITHDDLARLVGSSREMVSKVMGHFRQLGWIRSARKAIVLVDLPALEKITAVS